MRKFILMMGIALFIGAVGGYEAKANAAETRAQSYELAPECIAVAPEYGVECGAEIGLPTPDWTVEFTLQNIGVDLPDSVDVWADLPEYSIERRNLKFYDSPLSRRQMRYYKYFSLRNHYQYDYYGKSKKDC